MQQIIPTLSIIIILLYALYNAKFRDAEKIKTPMTKQYKEHIKSHKTTHYADELSQIDSDAYTKDYIIKVINHGSAILNFKGGVMEGGFASAEDAEKIACYVLTLSGRKCTTPYHEDATMFFTSICAGCHGNDGKGLGGTYPDLTKHKLLGIEMRESFLKSMLKHK